MPSATPAAFPVLLIVAAAEFDEVQLTRALTSVEPPALSIAVAAYCRFPQGAEAKSSGRSRLGLAGTFKPRRAAAAAGAPTNRVPSPGLMVRILVEGEDEEEQLASRTAMSGANIVGNRRLDPFRFVP
jgi:hypothetical protein